LRDALPDPCFPFRLSLEFCDPPSLFSGSAGFLAVSYLSLVIRSNVAWSPRIINDFLDIVISVDTSFADVFFFHPGWSVFEGDDVFPSLYSLELDFPILPVSLLLF